MDIRAMSRRGIVALAATALLVLAGCMLMPGKFTSDLDLRKDGSFAFRYAGEIQVLALSDQAAREGKEPFTPSPCYEQDVAEGQEEVLERPCTSTELAEQRGEWAEQQKQTAEKRKRDAKQMSGLLGGLDPSDPKAAQDLAARMRRQAGFRTVEYKGNGIYQVDYAVAGKLTHDFIFPSIEGFSMANAFVQLSLRDGGEVRLDAPGFAPAGSGNPMSSMMAGLAGSGESNETDAEMASVDGSFTLTTDGTIKANNTEEGAVAVPNGHKLHWSVNSRTQAAPMALIGLAALH